MKLISMTDFVIKTHNEIQDSIDSESMMFNYAKFLKQPLELWMFVPCDEEGNVLEEKEWKQFEGEYVILEAILNKHKVANERCLFEGYEYVSKWFETHLIAKDRISGAGQFQLCTFKTIEDLVEHDFRITQTAIKQIGI